MEINRNFKLIFVIWDQELIKFSKFKMLKEQIKLLI